MSGDKPTVSIFGASDPPAGGEAYELARSVGRKLAELGYDIANGGYGGTMEASARGAAEAGGRTTGVVCSVWKSRANKYIDQLVNTDSFADRLARLIELGEGGYVVLPGATGTLEELACVWNYLCKGELSGRPLVCVGEYWRAVVDLMLSAQPACGKYLAVVDGPDSLADFFVTGHLSPANGCDRHRQA